MSNKEVYNEKITLGSRTYFFDIKQSEQSKLYLKISESRKNDTGKFEHYRIIVFEEDIEYFVNALKLTLAKFNELLQTKNTTQRVKNKTYSVANIQLTYSRAYKPWSINDDNILEKMFREGKSVIELAKIFERKNSAILARIKKLELRDKYDH